jgi:hypothetical protein
MLCWNRTRSPRGPWGNCVANCAPGGGLPDPSASAVRRHDRRVFAVSGTRQFVVGERNDRQGDTCERIIWRRDRACATRGESHRYLCSGLPFRCRGTPH